MAMPLAEPSPAQQMLLTLLGDAAAWSMDRSEEALPIGQGYHAFARRRDEDRTVELVLHLSNNDHLVCAQTRPRFTFDPERLKQPESSAAMAAELEMCIRNSPAFRNILELSEEIIREWWE